MALGINGIEWFGFNYNKVDTKHVVNNRYLSSFQAFVISFTSDFIPRLVYQYMYSETGTMHGFINHTLSYFNVSNFKVGTIPAVSGLSKDITLCRLVAIKILEITVINFAWFIKEASKLIIIFIKNNLYYDYLVNNVLSHYSLMKTVASNKHTARTVLHNQQFSSPSKSFK